MRLHRSSARPSLVLLRVIRGRHGLTLPVAWGRDAGPLLRCPPGRGQSALPPRPSFVPIAPALPHGLSLKAAGRAASSCDDIFPRRGPFRALPRSAALGARCVLSEHAHHFTGAPALTFAKMPSRPGFVCTPSPALFGAHSPGPMPHASPARMEDASSSEYPAIGSTSPPVLAR